jgi:hypothetical protein
MKNKSDINHLALARRIRAAGVPVFIEQDDGEARSIPSDALQVRQTGGQIESSVFDWGGGTGIKIYLVITSKVSGLAVSHIELELPWKQTCFYWLEDPFVIDGPSPRYRFVGNQVLEFERDLVINHRLQITQQFSAGKSVKGFLLGFGFDSIPPEIRTGEMIPAFLSLYDQLGRQFRAPVELWLNRSGKNLRPARWVEKRKGGLLDKRDPIPK